MVKVFKALIGASPMRHSLEIHPPVQFHTPVKRALQSPQPQLDIEIECSGVVDCHPQK
jgi:hypothetical protein